MRAIITICGAATATIIAGATYLAQPARADVPAPSVGCTINQTLAASRAAQQFCVQQGYDGGYASTIDCDGPFMLVESQCW